MRFLSFVVYCSVLSLNRFNLGPSEIPVPTLMAFKLSGYVKDESGKYFSKTESP